MAGAPIDLEVIMVKAMNSDIDPMLASIEEQVRQLGVRLDRVEGHLGLQSSRSGAGRCLRLQSTPAKVTLRMCLADALPESRRAKVALFAFYLAIAVLSYRFSPF